MCDDAEAVHACADCRCCIPITKREATMVCNALPYNDALWRFKRQLVLCVAMALRKFGYCVYRAELVDMSQIQCDDGFWSDAMTGEGP